MKYFIDTEFIEGFHKHKGRQRHHVDLISIGIYAEDGREFHMISKEYDYEEASDWVKQNVLIPLYTQTVHGDSRNFVGSESFHKRFGKDHYAIRNALTDFFETENPSSIQFYGYYCDYDWVAFCSLFGTMMSLPKGFPMYCIDLKQVLDEKGIHLKQHPNYPKLQDNEHNALADAKWNYELYKFLMHIEQNPEECDAK